MPKAKLESKHYLIDHLSKVLEKLDQSKENITYSHNAFKEFIAKLKAEMASVGVQFTTTELYKMCESLEEEIKDLGVEITGAIAINRAHRQQYLRTVVDSLSYMQTYLQELGKLNTESDGLTDEINKVLGNSKLNEKTRSLQQGK